MVTGFQTFDLRQQIRGTWQPCMLKVMLCNNPAILAVGLMEAMDDPPYSTTRHVVSRRWHNGTPLDRCDRHQKIADLRSQPVLKADIIQICSKF
jgi:hypothetical protein